MAKHTIWENVDIDMDGWKDFLDEDYPSLDKNERYQMACKLNNDYIYDVRMNLSIQLNEDIIIIGNVGRWNGRFSGYKVVESGNIKDCLYSNCDYVDWYVDKNGDMKCTEEHHDGTNYLLYRAFKPGISDARIESLKNKLYSGTATRRDITRVTYRLGDYIGDVYGWTFPRRPAGCIK
jgi:hypothetical protein